MEFGMAAVLPFLQSHAHMLQQHAAVRTSCWRVMLLRGVRHFLVPYEKRAVPAHVNRLPESCAAVQLNSEDRCP
jgi:hypothetical protein